MTRTYVELLFLCIPSFFAVHFRRKRTENGFKKTSHTSANTFWQIEKLSDSISGKNNTCISSKCMHE